MSIVVVQGDDSVLVAQEVQSQVKLLVGGGDSSLMVEELTESQFVLEDGEQDIGPLVVAAQTPPFLTERRVVVGRHLGMFSRKADVEPLARVIASDLGSVDLVLVWEKPSDSKQRLAAIPKVLKEALTEAGAEIINAAPSGKARKTLLKEKLDMSGVNLDRDARALVEDTIGDDVGQLQALTDVLISTFGEGHRISVGDVKPYLPSPSDVPPWDLTDAIDSGNIKASIETLHRMLQGGERHALSVMAILHGHYNKALALDGAHVMGERQAAELLGMKGSTFPAKKALALSKRLGSSKIKRAISLLAQADIDLRGATALPAETVSEVLVARLAHNSKA